MAGHPTRIGPFRDRFLRSARGVQALTHDDAHSYTPPAAFGPFRVLHQIGSGVLGPVFRTYEPGRDRLVAVKVFLLGLLPEQGKELAEELQGLVEIGLDHPSIVTPLSAGQEGHTVYLAQEYIAAESLDVALRHLAPAPVTKVLPMLGQLAGALDFARARGVGHGALHPRDVFVAPEIAKATGFGIVQALERLGVRPPVRRPYSAPERVAGGEWSTPADVHALAAVTHELLTGKRAAGTGEVAVIAGMGPEPQAELLRTVLRRALAEDPQTRYPNARAFVSALEGASRGETQEPSAADRVGERPREARELAVELDVDVERHEELGEFDRDLADEGTPIELQEIDLAKLGTVAEPERIVDRFDGERIEEAFVPEAASTEEAILEEAVQEETVQAEVVEEEPSAVLPEEPVMAAAREEPPAKQRQEAEQRQERERQARAEAREEPEPWLFDVGDEEVPEATKPRIEATREPVQLEEAAAEPHAASGVDGEIMIESDERRRPTMLSFVAVALVFLAAGFLAGYGIGARQSRQAVTSAPPPSPTPAVAQPPQRAWSEAAVESPKAKPPAVVPPSEPPAPAESAAPRVVTPPPRRAVSPDVATARPSAPRVAEPRRAPASPVVGMGSFVADSRPPGAQVILDGRPLGKTPLKLANLKAGPHTVRLEMDGYRPWTTQITVVAGRDTRVAGSLERAPRR